MPGVSVAVVRDFAIHWTRGYGVADFATSAATTPTTLFEPPRSVSP